MKNAGSVDLTKNMLGMSWMATDSVSWVGSKAVEMIAKYFSEHPQTREFIAEVIVRENVVAQLLHNPILLFNKLNIFDRLMSLNRAHSEWLVRRISLELILKDYSTHPKTLELLHDRATHDPNEQLREWAQEQLETQNAKLTMEET